MKSNCKHVNISYAICIIVQFLLCSQCHCILVSVYTGNQLNCSTNVFFTDIGSFTVSLSWTQPVCSDVMPMHYLVQWAQERTSSLQSSDVIPMDDNSYTISSLSANTVYDFFLVVVDDCGSMTAGRQTAQTLESNGKCRIGGGTAVGALSSGMVCVTVEVHCTVV